MIMELTLEKKLQGFQLVAQEKLQAILCSIPGKKELILEPALIKPLEHVCTASWLKLKGIQRIYKHDAKQSLPRAADEVHIYMIRSLLGTYQTLLRQLQPLAMVETPDVSLKMYHIICVPSCYTYYQTLLEQAGLWGLVQLHHYNWDLIYFDQGVLSMELPNLYECLYLQGDSSPLPAVAQSLRLLQMICGPPAVILSFGSHSAQLLQMLQALGKLPESSSPPDYGGWLIIDRDKDYPSSLLTPAIYAGLLLEVFQQRAGEIVVDNSKNKISSQRVELLQSKQSSKGASSKPISVRLNSASDEIYGDNRYKHFAQASSWIRAQVKALGLELQKLNDMQLEEMHDYVARKLPKLTELKAKVLRHLNASEIVIQMLGNFRRLQALEEDILNNVSRKRLLGEIDELLTTDGQRYNTLRLLCLLHHCAGVAPEELQIFARNYCNMFGHRELGVFQQLAQAGLLPQLLPEKKAPTKLLANLPLPKFQQTEFQANANRLKLLTSCGDGPDGAASSKEVQSCPSFVFNGTYIPLVAQLCSILLRANTAEELSTKLAMIEGMQLHLDSSRQTTPKAYAAQQKTQPPGPAAASSGAEADVFPLRLRNLFVFVVGGANYAEIAACDFISKLTGAHITVASDSLMAGSDLIAAAFSN
ncbi:vacuolar protein sorting-associated protein 33B isoform X1 [Drosophila miranda]|uniref:vacuolar protein sorting-associated protein 33B isoform X1 n=2 Tax=Drosophila miranda TaxID=7229 RepID=UPI0007E64E41|nr:vacuolar protein sorting-associated protein 33B isoform X1 [Drosophila miranda]